MVAWWDQTQMTFAHKISHNYVLRFNRSAKLINLFKGGGAYSDDIHFSRLDLDPDCCSSAFHSNHDLFSLFNHLIGTGHI